MKKAKENDNAEAKPKADASEDTVILPRKEFEALNQQIVELEGLRDKMMRAAADFENAKKRLIRERDEYVAYAQERLIRELLPLLDNFERALSHASEVEDPKAKNVITGVQMVFKRMAEVLKIEGLERLETVGKIFDPNWHEAVASVEEEGRDHEIIEELEPGYLLKGRLVRAAKVRIRVAPKSSKDSAA